MAYNSKYTGQQVEDVLDSVNGKQDLIEDLDAIREGASKGATALQSIPSEYVTESDLNKKVDKVTGKGLSTEDFTTALKTKLEGLSNYDDTELSDALSTLRGDFDKLVSGDTTTAIKTFNEVIAFLDGIEDSEDLNSIIASIEQQIANKANADSLAKVATSGSYDDLTNKPTIPSAVTESTVSGWGFTKNTGTYSKPSTGIPKTDMASAVQTSLDKADTALQSYTEQYKGTITGVSANGTSVATSGVANIPAATTGKYGVTKLSSATNSTSTTLAATPSAVKSAYDLANGKYTKPSTGIPFGDFEEQVQGSIIKAEESVQSVSMSVTTGNATAGNFFNVNKDANGNVSIQMIQNTLASGKIAIPYTTDVKQYIDNAVANAGGGGGSGGGGAEVYTAPFTVEDITSDLVYIELTQEQLDGLGAAASQNKLIAIPFRDNSLSEIKGFIVTNYSYSNDEDRWEVKLIFTYSAVEYIIAINSNNPLLSSSRISKTHFLPKIYEVFAEDGFVDIVDDLSYSDNVIWYVGGECTELYISAEPSTLGKTIRFYTGSDCTLNFGYNVYWANGVIPTIEPYTHYELSLVANMDFGSNAVLTPFKFLES